MTRKGGMPYEVRISKINFPDGRRLYDFSLSFAESVPEVRSNAENSNWLAVTDHKWKEK